MSNDSKAKAMSAWELGENVIVQVPQDDGFATYVGTVSGVDEEGKVEVYVNSRRKSFLAEPDWVYPEDWLRS